MRSEARFEVKWLFMTAYRYEHLSLERWRGDCLTGIESRTRDGDETLAVGSSLAGDRLVVQGPKGEVVLPPCPMTFAYWNPRILQASHLLNAQTGEYLAVRSVFLGEERLVVAGAPRSARRYALRARGLEIDLWYDEAGQWLALESRVAGGRRLRYHLEARTP